MFGHNEMLRKYIQYESMIDNELLQWETIQNIILKWFYETKINPSMCNPNIVIKNKIINNTSYTNELDNIQFIETFYE